MLSESLATSLSTDHSSGQTSHKSGSRLYVRIVDAACSASLGWSRYRLYMNGLHCKVFSLTIWSKSLRLWLQHWSRFTYRGVLQDTAVVNCSHDTFLCTHCGRADWLQILPKHFNKPDTKLRTSHTCADLASDLIMTSMTVDYPINEHHIRVQTLPLTW